MIVIGLMSGTSADGIDAAVTEIEGAPPQLRWRLRAHIHTPFSRAQQKEILTLVDPARSGVDLLCELNFSLGRAYAEAALAAAAAAGLKAEEVDLIGSHGQTVWHEPLGTYPATLQLGEASVIAEETGITTISNFRARDCAAGGQGAPLVAYVDWLLFAHATRVRAAQNIGGIANVTFLPPSGGQGLDVMAFDTGPGNMLIDDAARRATNGGAAYDRDGLIAARGQVHEGLLDELLDHPYLGKEPPKTTGREDFGAQYGGAVWAVARDLGLGPEDVVATMTAFSAHSIAQAYRRFLPRFPDEVVLSGGGAYNPVLVAQLAELLAPARVVTSAELGLPVEAKEALAFAVLAYETWHGRPGNLPQATGARHPVILGQITPGRRGYFPA